MPGRLAGWARVGAHSLRRNQAHGQRAASHAGGGSVSERGAKPCDGDQRSAPHTALARGGGGGGGALPHAHRPHTVPRSGTALKRWHGAPGAGCGGGRARTAQAVAALTLQSAAVPLNLWLPRFGGDLLSDVKQNPVPLSVYVTPAPGPHGGGDPNRRRGPHSTPASTGSARPPHRIKAGQRTGVNQKQGWAA